MIIPLVRHIKQPLYLQIHQYLRDSILAGSLPPHTRLPASRHLARDLGVSRITVDNAYAELISEGLVEARPGSGTYVLPLLPARGASTGTLTEWPLWQQLLVQKKEELFTEHPQHDVVSFALGCGDQNLFPVADFRKALATAMSENPEASLDYGEPCGYFGLRATIAQVLCSQGLRTAADNILITAGSQQALTLVAQVLLRPGDTVIVELPTYGKALELFNSLQLRVVTIPIDNEGMQTELLEPLLQAHHPKLIYTMPNFQNPSGVCLSSKRRRELVTLADRYNVPILEDDFVGDLRYDGPSQPALKALDPGGRVIYTSTFSKMLLPGLRIGFAVAEGPVYRALVKRKEVQDLATSSLIQHALDRYITIGRYQAHLRRSCQVYRKRRDALVAALNKYLPSASFSTPLGGLFVWVRLPTGLSAVDLLHVSYAYGVSFTPGHAFCTDGTLNSYIRLNFAALTVEKINEGIRQLAIAVANLQHGE